MTATPRRATSPRPRVLRAHRHSMGIDAKLVVIGMSNSFSISLGSVFGAWAARLLVRRARQSTCERAQSVVGLRTQRTEVTWVATKPEVHRHKFHRHPCQVRSGTARPGPECLVATAAAAASLSRSSSLPAVEARSASPPEPHLHHRAKRGKPIWPRSPDRVPPPKPPPSFATLLDPLSAAPWCGQISRRCYQHAGQLRAAESCSGSITRKRSPVGWSATRSADRRSRSSSPP